MINTMSNFDVKLILCKDIVTMGKWFSNGIKISGDHLNFYKDLWMNYLYAEVEVAHRIQIPKAEIKI